MNWEYDIMSESQTDLGGIKETFLSISGRSSGGTVFYQDNEEDQAILSQVGLYGFLKYDSDIHRVQ
jgi:protein subunit release factor A